MFALQTQIIGSTPREHPEIWAQSDPPPVDLSVGDIRSQIAAEWLQIAQRSQWRAYSYNHHRSFEWCHRWPPTTSPPPNGGFHMPPRYANGHISATGDPIYFMFGSKVEFSESADWMALFLVRPTSNPRWRLAAILEDGGWPPSWIIPNGRI